MTCQAGASAAADLVFAVRVGALAGRHPEVGGQALGRMVAATTVDARLFIDGGDPLRLKAPDDAERAAADVAAGDVEDAGDVGDGSAGEEHRGDREVLRE
jgi:hypothetical protein